MNKETKGGKALNVFGALMTATGVVALGSVVASGAAVGALVEGFKAAGKIVKDSLADQPKEVDESSESVEESAVEENTSEEKAMEEKVIEEVTTLSR